MFTKKKTLATIAAALSICTVLSACGGQKAKTADDISEEDIEQALSDMETMKEEELESKLESLENQNKNDEAKNEQQDDGIKPTQEILDADIYSNKLQLGNSVFTYPSFPVSELLEANVRFEKLDPNTTIIEPKKTQIDKVYIDGEKYSLTFMNTTDDRQLLKDCICGRFDGIMGFNSNSRENNYICPKGIKVGSTVDELLAAYGEPVYKDIDMYYYTSKCITTSYGVFADHHILYKDGNTKYYKPYNDSIIFKINLEDNTISSISYTPPINDFHKTISNTDDSPSLITDETRDFRSFKGNCSVSFTYPDSYFPVKQNYHAYLSEESNPMLVYSYTGTGFTSSSNVFQSYLSEYTDEILTQYCNDIITYNLRPEKEDTTGFEYRINDDNTAAVYVYKILHGDIDDVRVIVYYFNQDYVGVKIDGIDVRGYNEKTNITAEDMSSLRDALFSLTENVSVNLEFVE